MSLSRLLVLCCTLLLPALSIAADTTAPAPLLLQERGDFPIGRHTQWLQDSHHELTPAAALAAPDWQNGEDDSLNFGFTHSAYWLKTGLRSGELSHWALWVRYSLLDQADIWLCPQPVTDVLQCDYQRSGDLQPFADNRPYAHPNIIATLNFPTPHQDYLLLMRVVTEGTFQLPASLTDTATLEDNLLGNNMLRGAYYATMLVMGLYNLFIFFSTRERTYLYYSGFVLTFLFFHMVYEGSAFQFFWPEAPSLNHYALPVSFAINMLVISLFVPNFLSLKERSPGAFRLFRGFSALALVCVLMLPLLHYHLLVQILNLLSIVLTSSAIVVGIRFWLQGYSSARFFTIAWAALITGLIMANARSLGLIPTNTITLYAYQIGSFMEVILLSLALGERIMTLQKDQLQARKALLKSQEDAIQYLRDFEDLYQNSLSGKFQIDSDGYFSKSNPAWRAILGYSDNTYFSSDNPRFNSLFSDAKQRRSFWKELKEYGRIQARVVSFVQPVTGERIMVSLTLRKGNSDRAAWFGSGQDVTENYLKEQALIQLQKEKTQSLRQLVMGISHEMNSPLGNIRMAETFLNEDHQEWDDNERREHMHKGLEFIHQGAERLHELNQLMKSAVVQENQYASDLIQLRPWLQSWQEHKLKQDERLQLRTAVHSYLVEWPTYPEALGIVLDQLLDNSCTHNTELHDAGELRVSIDFRERGDYLELHYEDNGKGISAEQRDNIFMPFYTTRRSEARSKGLGLYQTYNLLTELLQGHIEWPDDAAGFYLVVRFNLPLPVEKTERKEDHRPEEITVLDD